MPHYHSVLYSIDPKTREILRMNDEMRLDGFMSYTIPQYVHDQAADGIHVLKSVDGWFLFSDGTEEILIQQVEPFDPRESGLPDDPSRNPSVDGDHSSNGSRLDEVAA